MDKKFITNKYKTYLVGAIENTAGDDGGKNWRESITPNLEQLGVFVFDPIKLESSKVNKSPEEFMEMIMGLKRSGNWKIFMNHMNKIWVGTDYMEDGELFHVMGDTDYVNVSDFLVANIRLGDTPGGTYIEFALAYFQGKPIYLVTDINKCDLNSSIIWLVLASGGEIFRSFASMLDFIKGRYNLKENEPDDE